MRLKNYELMALIAGFVAVQWLPAQENLISGSDTDSKTAVLGSPQASSSDVVEEETPPPQSPPEPAPALEQYAAVTPTVLATNAALEEVVRQIRAGVDESVLLNFIQSSSVPFNVATEEIIYLTDVGASGQIINAMIEQDHALEFADTGEQTASVAQEPWPAAGTVEPVPAANVELEAPAVTETLVEPPSTGVTVDYFYDYLAPYGSWVNIPGYGLCWQPSVAISTSGWMPYSDRGRWAYTDCGWYWYSDYSWGWAPFHYGRWFHHTRWGWCWVPGTVWGPSWVTWRYADSYCGWAPLPPYSRTGFYFSVGISWGIPSWCYTYVPSYRICNYYPRTCAVPYAQARSIHRRARICDDYSVARNNTIQNRGIPPETIARDSGAKIRRVRITERNEIPSATARRERMDNDGKTLTVYRPQVTRRTEPASRQRDVREGSTRKLAETASYTTTQAQPSRSRTEAANSGGRRQADYDQTSLTSRNLAPTASQQRTFQTSSTAESPASRVQSRSEPSPRDRTVSRPAQTAGQTVQVNPSAATRSRTSTGGETSIPRSSLIVIGRGDATTSSPNVSPSRQVISSSSTRNLSSASAATSADRSNVRSEPTLQSRNIQTWSSSSRTQPPATTSTRSQSSLPSRALSSPVTRSFDVTRSSATPTRTIAQPTPRTSYSSPVQRTVTPSSPSRTISQPIQSQRPTQSVRTSVPVSTTPRSSTSYSAPAAASRTPAPVSSRSASPSRAAERTSSRGR